MKLIELLFESSEAGTYVGVQFTEDTAAAIGSYITSNDIPNAINTSKLHTTVVYSRKRLPNLTVTEDALYSQPYRANGLAKWKTQDGKTALVMTYDAPELLARHKEIRDVHGATHDFDDYTPHITLSYDVGDDFDIESVNLFDGEIQIAHEYMNDLDLNWKA